MKSVIAEREVGGWDKLKLPPPILKVLLESHLHAHILCPGALQDHPLEWEVGEFPPHRPWVGLRVWTQPVKCRQE